MIALRLLLPTQNTVTYQCGDTYNFSGGQPPATCPDHSWAKISQATVTYQCGDTYTFYDMPPATCPDHSWAKIQ